MFIRLKHKMKAADSRQVKLTTHMKYELHIWHHFFDLLAELITHMREIRLCPLMWTEGKDASLTGIEGTCCRTSR